MLNVRQDFEQRAVLLTVAVVVFPLEEADPDDDAGDLVGVEVDFYAVELAGVGDGFERKGEAVLEAELAGLMPEVEQSLEGDVEEVSGAAGWIENADRGEFGGPGLQDGEGGAVDAQAGGEFAVAVEGRLGGEGFEDLFLDGCPAT